MSVVHGRPSPRPHGTRAKYVSERCRCGDCRTAVREYERWRVKQRAYGRTPYIDAEPVREHVRQQQAAGMGAKTVAQRAGVSPTVVSKLLYGDAGRGQAPTKRVSRATARAILAVTPDLEPGARIGGAGTRRRLQALVAIGWTRRELAAQLGRTESNFGRTLRSDRVTVATARQATDLYERLWDQPPLGAIADRTRAEAARKGWPLPMAWDDDAIDDPAAEPARTETRGRGRPAVIDLGEVAWLRAVGIGDEFIAARLGVRAESIRRAEQRARTRTDHEETA